MHITHDCWGGIATQFRQWRNALAVAAGYRLMSTVSGLGQTIEVPYLDWASFTAEQREGNWRASGYPADILLVLLVHSDTYGHIGPEAAAPLADRLEALLASLPADTPFDFHRARTETFVAGLRRAAETGTRIEFSP